MNKFRASFSVLDTWFKGDYERAVKMYFKMDDFETEAMKQGKEFHKQWQEETNKTGALPIVFGGKKLNNPKTENKTVVQIYDWLELVGVIDCIDEPTIYEYKTGITESQIYANSHQIGVYGLLATYNDILVTQCEIHHYNQHKGKADMSKIYLTEKLISDSLNWILTEAGEMHSYLESNNLYEKLKK